MIKSLKVPLGFEIFHEEPLEIMITVSLMTTLLLLI